MARRSPSSTDVLELRFEVEEANADAWEELLKGVFIQGRDERPLLDDVFAAFFQTAEFRGQRYTLLEVLATTSKKYLDFQHCSIPYRATIRRREESSYDVVQLQLPNNGFSYQLLGQGQPYTRHNSKGWRSLPANTCLQNFPTISDMCAAYYDHGRLYYNQSTQRVDIQLRPKPASNLPVFEICFEPGYAEERAPWQPVFQ